MISRRELLAAGAALAVSSPVRAEDLRSLSGLAAAKSLLFGCAAASYQWKDADFPPALMREAALLVPEYEMKRNAIEPQQGRYDFSALDTLFGLAARGGLGMRGHPLVWYAANPPWLEAAVRAGRGEKLLTDYIAAVMGRYRGRLHSVDVVNEAIAPGGEGLRRSFWLERFGPSYIDTAFLAARQADPDILLVYNDWGFEQGAPANDRFRRETLKLLDGLIARRIPVGALGMQGHLSAFGTKVDQNKLRAFAAEIQSRGLALLITELDVDDTGGSLDPSLRDRAVADEARRFLDVVLDSPATTTVLTWGLSDRYLDPPDEWKLKLIGWRGRKLPYDAQMRRKPLWDSIARSFAGRSISY
jgi:endo-1,4-beta-xylanase